MKLIYRANIYDYTPPAPQLYRQPYALNWRYQVPGEIYSGPPPSFEMYHFPLALNWRYQPR